MISRALLLLFDWFSLPRVGLPTKVRISNSWLDFIVELIVLKLTIKVDMIDLVELFSIYLSWSMFNVTIILFNISVNNVEFEVSKLIILFSILILSAIWIQYCILEVVTSIIIEY